MTQQSPQESTHENLGARIWRARPWLRNSLLGVLALFFLVTGFAAFVLPGIVRAQAERAGTEVLHRKLSIEQLEIHPFALAVSIQGVRLFEPDGKTVFASFARLDTRISAASLLHMAPIVREVRLVDPYVRLVRTGAGEYSFDDIRAALAAAPPAPQPRSTAPPQFAVHNIRIDGGRFEFDDVPAKAHHTIANFSLGIPFVSTFAAEEEVFVEPSLAAVIDGAPLGLQGRARPFAQTPEAQLDLNFEKINLARYAQYLPPGSGVQVPSGELDLHLQATFALPKAGVPEIGLAGSIAARSLSVIPAPGKAPLKLAQIRLDVAHAQLPAGQLDATLTINGKGRIVARGETALAPLHADLDVAIEELDLLPVQPLFADRVNVRLTRAELFAKGHVRLDQEATGPLRGGFRGDVRVARLATLDVINNNDFVNWDALNLQGMGLELTPFSLHIDRVALTNYFARIIINPQGTINLQDIVRGKSEQQRSLTEAGGAAAATDAAPAPAIASTPAPAGATAAATTLAPVSVGELALQGGHVRFTDKFIQPHYSADLVDLAGNISGLSTQAKVPARIDLHGQANGAPLLIGGTVLASGSDLALDVKASVHDMELAPLSAYSGKYVGYRIERGKLSFDVAYQLQNRQLRAENRLVLDQLTFGEKVESASATSLPVQLAIALLKDRNGVIDINLPIGGSLDDPDFSIGGVLLRVFVNLVTKAVTAPFALLGSLFGGGEELSSIDFAPGSTEVSAAALPRLQGLAKALTERPALKLDITGWGDPRIDTEALQQRALESKLRELKRADLIAKSALVRSAEVVVTPQEYPELLARLYRTQAGALAGTQAAGGPAAASPAADAAQKPGDGKSAPTSVAQMESQLRAQQQISDDDLRRLGNQRAQEAKDWLKTVGLVPEERLSLVGAHIGTADKPEPTARVEFGLH